METSERKQWSGRVASAFADVRGRLRAAVTSRPGVRWRAAYGVALAVAVMTILVGTWLTWRVESMTRASFERDVMLQAKAVATTPQLLQAWLAGPDRLKLELKALSTILDAQIAVLTTTGQLVADSRMNGETTHEWTTYPEVRSALAGSEGRSTRSDATDGPRLFWVAVPVREGGMTWGVLHLTFPRHRLEADLGALRTTVAGVSAVIALLLGGLVVVWADYTTYGVRRINQVVERITAGDLDARILSLQRGELGQLATAFNRMADKLQNQMKKRAREKDRLNAVMHVMTDGLVILNRAGEVRMINPAAARVLDTTPERALNRSFVQAVRDHRIVEVLKTCQETGRESVAAIELGGGQFLRVVVTPLLRRTRRSYLVMLQDLTQVRRLQMVRQDFISNISHELRTPMASLRALVETLRDSALDDPPAATRFLDRMEIEVDALTQMVEELLELSRIESGQVPLRLNPVLPYAAISPPVERLRPQAERGQVTLTVEVPEDLPPVLVDAGRIHQVVTNLVHNAIKFTLPGGHVVVRVQPAPGDGVLVSVADTGIGITEKDLPRIFERFFKTDRSRAIGGTGLGLAIAKHIVQAHGGRIWAESVEGKGSTLFFTMLPAEGTQAEDEDAGGVIAVANGRPNLQPRSSADINRTFTFP